MKKNKLVGMSLSGIFLLILIAAGTIVNAQDFGRREKLNDDWYFNPGDIRYGGIENMDCSKWAVVDLPHDWTVEQNASPELASCTGYLPEALPGTEKKLLSLPRRRKQGLYLF